MILKPRPIDQSEIEKLWARGVPRGKAVNIEYSETSYLPSIWVMELPNEAYTAPRGAFWFVSTGVGR